MNIWDINTELPKTRSGIREIIETYESDRDLFYLAGLIMSARYEVTHDEISSLFSLVESKSLKRLCKVLGGQTIRIPTYDELIDSLKMIKFTYEYSKGRSVPEAMRSAGYDMSDLDRVTDQYMKLTEVLKSNDSK